MRIGIVVQEFEETPHETQQISAEIMKRELEKLGHKAYIFYFEKEGKIEDKDIKHISQAKFTKLDAFYLSGKIYNKHFLKLILMSIIKGKKIHFRIPSYNLKLFKKFKLLLKILVKLKILELYCFDKIHEQAIKNELGIDARILEPAINLQSLNKKQVKKEIDILFIGSYDDRKRGLEELLEAVKILRNKKKKIKLKILSKYGFYDGENKEGLWALDLVKKLGIKKNVIFSGKVKNIYDEYKKSKVYVLPIKTFKLMPPIPYSILESLYYETPVLATDHHGIPLILDKKFLLKKKLNSEEIAEKISWVLKNKPKVTLDKKFLPENTVKKFLSYL